MMDVDQETNNNDDESSSSCSRNNTSRKRTRDNDDDNGRVGETNESGGDCSGNSTPTVRDLSLQDDDDYSSNGNSPPHQKKTTNMPPIKSLSLEAIFHPKFENESTSNHSIRGQMKQHVLAGRGYVEVSLKHSGSLLLWSGGQRYYSKNATDNQFTYVGEILLRQHFYRAYYVPHSSSSSSSSSSDDGATTTTSDVSHHHHDSYEAHYQACSDYVQSHRLTLAFEVVTAILGHHGDIPSRDFLILTAVADRNTEQFYSTCEIIQFAQRFRLPHNDTWVFDSKDSVDGLFDLYDSTRETGLATDTIAALNRIANIHISSMYPHTIFQGNILEGIVIRYVAYHDKEREQKTLRDLAAESQILLTLVPPERPPSFVLTAQDSKSPSVLAVDLRNICRNVMATGDRDTVSKFLETTARDIFRSTDGEMHRRRVVREHAQQVGKEWTGANFPSALRRALANETLDRESQRILKLVKTLDSLTGRVDYRLVKETTTPSGCDGHLSLKEDRWLCVVHVFHDTTHQKFRRAMGPNDMMLFRGFCIKLGTEPNEEKVNVDESNVQEVSARGVTDDSGLMLKMKFLPYMVRTFGCRNGLQVIRKSGPSAFTQHTMKLMTKWGMSAEAKAKWQPFFAAWGKYAHMCLTKKTHEYSDKSLPKLCDTFYLEHFDHFTRLYESGKIVGDVEDHQSSSTSVFRGLVIVVGFNHEKADVVADAISDRLGGLVVRRGLHSLAAEDWDAACLSRRVGMICTVAVSDGASSVRKRLKDYGEAVFGVLVGFDDVGILADSAKVDKAAQVAQSADSTTSSKKLKGMIRTWRDTRFTKISEISYDCFVGESTGCDAIRRVVEDLEGASGALPSRDDRPGLLVFFPSIPGSGKSLLCSKDTEDEVRRALGQADKAEPKSNDRADKVSPRPVIIRMGDEVKKKYWPLVNVERTKNPSSVYLADKNAPPSAWRSVAQVCSVTNGVAVPVINGGAALRTTTVEGVGHFPFSLPFLAVCMARVVCRPAESHAGKLDRSTDLACMVVVKFFSLYRNIDANDLIPLIRGEMERGGTTMASSPIIVPFFAEEGLPKLPSDLENALLDALRIQYEYDVVLDKKISRNDARVSEIETQLRNLVEIHKDMLLSLSADPVVSRQSFVSQVAEQAAVLPSSLDVLPQHVSFFKIASIDLNKDLVHSALAEAASKYPRIQTLLAHGEGKIDSDNHVVLTANNFVDDTHVTMVHCSQAPQSTIRSQFEHLTGCTVDVKIVGMLWNDQIAAFAVQVAQCTKDKPDVPVPTPKNAFPHVTIWHRPGVSPALSNKLPQLVEEGRAERVDFDDPLVIEGGVSLWGEDRG